MRLEAGQHAPGFSATDLHGQEVTLDQYRGRYLLLSFYRFASCPFCNLRIHELIQRMPELERHKLSLAAVFQSERDRLLAYAGNQRPPFPILPDLNRRLYRLYGIESSLYGLVAGFVLHLGRAMKSMRMGFLPGPTDGGTTLIPADFLIGPDGTIVTAYYGRDIADHLPVAALLRTLGSSPGQHAILNRNP